MTGNKELFALLHHLRDCPPEFLAIGRTPEEKVNTTALLYDLFRLVYGDYTVTTSQLPSLKELSIQYYGENESRSIHIGIWFFSFPLFHTKPQLLVGIKNFLLNRLPALCRYINYQAWLEDEDRSEEFVREALQCCSMLIDGETLEESQDRLDALSTLKRHKILKETNESMERMKAIRQKMEEQKAREAANVYGRE